jgi:glucan phosphoethanolaminetransferase (alkaline phosphatase superfamily)
MNPDASSKWPKLIWSIVIIAAFTIYADKLSANSSNILGVFGFFFVGWGIALTASIVAFMLRLFRVLHRWSFLYIFVSAAALFLSVCGLWLTKGYYSGYIFWVFLYFLTLALSTLMLIDIFVVEIPGLLNRPKR